MALFTSGSKQNMARQLNYRGVNLRLCFSLLSLESIGFSLGVDSVAAPTVTSVLECVSDSRHNCISCKSVALRQLLVGGQCQVLILWVTKQRVKVSRVCLEEAF